MAFFSPQRSPSTEPKNGSVLNTQRYDSAEIFLSSIKIMHIGGPGIKNLPASTGEHRFDPWPGKISHDVIH